MKDDSVRESIDSISLRIEQRLSAGSDDLLAWEPVPLSLYCRKLPDLIRSSWVFVIRAKTNTGAERHPNSHQFMMSYRGKGDLQVKTGNKWLSNCLVSNLDKKLEKRWISILPGTWHRAIALADNWAVVSFHTVAADELIEERPDPDNNDLVHQRHYINDKK